MPLSHHHHPVPQPSSVQSTPSKSFVASAASPHPLQHSPSNSSVGSQHQFLPLQQKQRSFLTFGFGAGSTGSGGGTGGSGGNASRRESHVNVNVTPTGHDVSSDTPEIRKYKKRFNSEILCAALWGKYATKMKIMRLHNLRFISRHIFVFMHFLNKYT